MYRITAVINKAGGATVSWFFYSERRMMLEQCETMLSRGREAGRHNGFRVTLTEFSRPTGWAVGLLSSAPVKKH